jgi:hypothetical protein
MNRNQFLTTALFLLTLSTLAHAATGSWASKATGGNITYTTNEAATPLKDFSGNYLTIVYLENLGIRKIGGNSNATDLAWLLSQGYRVIELDYANHVNAVSPALNLDIIDINHALAGTFCGLANCSKYRSWVLFEGYRIARDIPYFLDDPTVYNYPAAYTVGDSLRMDIIYPANASVAVPAVLSFSYSNSFASDLNRNNRMNLGNTLSGYNDSFLEGAPANGIAWAIADHPKYCDWAQGKPVGGANKAYGSFETNPDAAQKVKSAVRTLRALGSPLGLSGKIGVYGFSRGSTAGSMAIGDRTVSTFENAGFNKDVDDGIQVAALGSGVFDYTQIFLDAESDVGTLRTNCPLVWGPLATNFEKWRTMGSYYLLETAASAPVIFFYNTDDALYYQHQIKHFKAKLDSLGITTDSVINYGISHAVPQTAGPLTKVYNFFKTYLTPPSMAAGLAQTVDRVLSLSVLPNLASNTIQLTFTLAQAGTVQIELFDISGKVWYKNEKYFERTGLQSDTIHLAAPPLSNGVYYVRVTAGGVQGLSKFVKNK